MKQSDFKNYPLFDAYRFHGSELMPIVGVLVGVTPPPSFMCTPDVVEKAVLIFLEIAEFDVYNCKGALINDIRFNIGTG